MANLKAISSSATLSRNIEYYHLLHVLIEFVSDLAKPATGFNSMAV